MGDEEIGQPPFLLGFHQQVENLSLNGLADRLFLDLDGCMDRMVGVAPKGLIVYKNKFNEFKPFLDIEII
jgi:hypothetical protein